MKRKLRPRPLNTRLLQALAACVGAVVLLSQAQAQPSGVGVCTTGTNLLVNGGAEADPSATGTGSSDHDVTGWDNEVGQFTITRYTVGGGYPTASSPGPDNRGTFFFSGGQTATSSASQVIDVSGCGTQIDAGTQRFRLSGFLGGFSSQADHAQLSVTFLGAANEILGTTTIGPVTAAQRSNVTGLFLRGTSGLVPAGTRTIEAVLLMTRIDTSGSSNDGYADNLSFQFLPEGPETWNAREEFTLTQGGTTGVWTYGFSNSATDNTFTPFTESRIGRPCGDNTFEDWYRTGEPFSLPLIRGNSGTNLCTIPRFGMLNLHPSASGRRAVLRWTAPTAGTFLLHGVFNGDDSGGGGTTTDVKILKNTTETLFSGDVFGFNAQQPFTFPVTVAAGDTIDFSVGNGNGTEGFDSTGLTVTIGPADTECQVPPAGLLVHIPAENSTADIVGQNFGGQLLGDAGYGNGKVGRAFTFDGNGDFVVLPPKANQNITGDLTIETWIKPTVVTGVQRVIVDKRNDDNTNTAYSLFLEADGRLAFASRMGGGSYHTVQAGGALPTNAYTHVAVVISGTSLFLYRNGVEVHQQAYNVVRPVSTGSLQIGGLRLNGYVGAFFHGQIDEVAIYDRALSASEMSEIVRYGSLGKCLPAGCAETPQGLVSWYEADQNALDSRSGNHAEFTGAAYVHGRVGQAFSFNGTSSFVAAPDHDSLDITEDLTIEGWIHPSSDPALSHIVSKRSADGANAEYNLLRQADGRLRFSSKLGATETFVVSDGGTPAGAFSHVAVTIQGNTLRFYIDGTLDSTHSYSATRAATTGRLTIGAAETAACGGAGTCEFFAGEIDELSLYNRAVSADEIAAIAAAGGSGKCKPSPIAPPEDKIAWYTADGTDKDFAGANDGTLNGTYTVGAVGQAFRFNGSNEYLATNLYISPAEHLNVTIEGWIFPTSAGTIFAADDGSFDRGLHAHSHAFYVYRGGQGQDLVGRVDYNQWQHVALVYENTSLTSGTVRFYKNGELIHTASVSGQQSTNPLNIGRNPYGGGCCNFGGSVDEVGVYSRGLTQAEITAIFRAGAAGKVKASSTPAGSNVQTELSGVTVAIGTVAAAGVTSQTGLDLGALPPLPLNVTYTGLGYDISTTATYQTGRGAVQVCFNVPALANSTFSSLRVLHLENGVWISRTNRSSTAPTLCTSGVSSLSPFVIVESDSGIEGLDDLVTAEDTAVSAGFTLTNHSTVTNVSATSSNQALVPDANLTISGTGANRTLHIAPAANQHGEVQITVTAQQGAESVSETISLFISEVNDPPAAVLDVLSSIAEDSSPLTIPIASLLANDLPGPPNEGDQTITFVSATNGSGGTIVVEGDNVIFTPAPDYYGGANFTYTIQDNGTTNGASDPKTAHGFVSIHITEVNDPPVAVNDSLTPIEEDSGVRTIPFSALLPNDSQGPFENNQTITVVSVGEAIGGTVSIDGANVLFAPAQDFNGPASFTYVVRDNGTTNGSPNHLSSAPATVSFIITEVNDAPLASADALGPVAEDSGERIIPFADLLQNDIAGPLNESDQSFTIVSVSDPAGGAVSISGTNVVFTPADNFNGAASFTYVIQDNGTTNGQPDPLLSAPAMVSFTVSEVNDVPVAVNDSLTEIAEDSGVRTIPFGDLLANDSTGPENEGDQTITVSSVGEAVGGTVVIEGTDVLFTPAQDFNGPASFTYVIQDSGTTNGDADPLPSTPATVSFTITEVNDIPLAAADALSAIAEDSGPRTIAIADLLANDSTGPENENDQTLTLVSVADAVGGSVVINGTDVIFTPELHFNGPASFTYVVQDDGTTDGEADPLTSAPVTVSFTVTEVNDLPIVADEVLTSIAEDSGPRTIPFADLLANDMPGPANESSQSLTIVSVSNAVGGNVSITGTDVVFTPNPDYNGPASFTYIVQDNGTTNGAPDPLMAEPGTVTFTITEVNDVPVAAADVLSSVAEDSGQRTIAFADLLANDSTGPANEADQTITVVSVGDAVGGTVTINGTDVLFTPAQDFNGPASFSYIVRDNGTTNGAADPRDSAPATVSFTVTEVNDAPVAVNDALSSIAEDSGARTIAFTDLLTNDSAGPANEAGQELVITSVSDAVGGSVVIDGTNVIFTPTADHNGPASFTYLMQDNGTTNGAADFQTSAPATVSFTVTPVNDAPTFTQGADQSLNEDAGEQTIADWATDISAGPANESDQTVSFVVTTDNNALFAVQPEVSATGTLSYTPALNQNGTAIVTVTAVDNGGTANGGQDTSPAQTFTITIAAVNDAPSFTAGADQIVNEDAGEQTVGKWATDISAGPADEAAQTVSFTTTNDNNALFTVPPAISPDGTLSYTPAADANGTATITVTLADNGGTANGGADTSAPQLFTITVNSVNDAPTFTKGPDLAHHRNAGAQLIPNWATNISPGPANEADQTVQFVINGNSNGSLFTVQPAISPEGTLSYTLADNVSGSALLTVVLVDNGGTANGGQDTSAMQSFTITIYTGMQSWQQQHFTEEELQDPSISGPTADPNNNGIPNLLEYALGLDPRTIGGSRGISTGIVTVDGQKYLSLSYTQPAGSATPSDIIYTAEIAGELVNPDWSSAAEDVITHSVAPGPGALQTVTVRSTRPVHTEPREFLRLTVTVVQ